MYHSFDESETSERLGQTSLLKTAARSINFLLLSNNNNNNNNSDNIIYLKILLKIYNIKILLILSNNKNNINNHFIYFLSLNGFSRATRDLDGYKSN